MMDTNISKKWSARDFRRYWLFVIFLVTADIAIFFLFYYVTENSGRGFFSSSDFYELLAIQPYNFLIPVLLIREEKRRASMDVGTRLRRVQALIATAMVGASILATALVVWL